MNEPTKKMIIPIVQDNQIIFCTQHNMFIGTQYHFGLEQINGNNPYEISFEQAIILLNGSDKKYPLKYCKISPEINFEIEFDIDVSDL